MIERAGHSVAPEVYSAEAPGPRFSCHPRLREDLRRFGVDELSPPARDEWSGLLRVMNATYYEREHARQAVEQSNDLIANVSHELRTSLNAILGFTPVLQRKLERALSSSDEPLFGYVTQAAERMLRLVIDLSDLHSLHDGELTLAPVDPGLVVREAVEAVRGHAQCKRIALSIDVPDDAPQILAERGATTQALGQLLTNAIKFTAGVGAIYVTVAHVHPWMRFDVKDSGPGIEPSSHPHLFSYFAQSGAKSRLHMKGSGIGLALAKALIDKQNGSIQVVSTPGMGSTFSIYLPVAVVHDAHTTR